MLKNSVSFIIPCFNEQPKIGDTLSSIAVACRETGLQNYQVNVIDDGSEDATALVAETLARDLGLENFKLIVHATNRGLADAVRTGIQNSNSVEVMIVPGEGDISTDGITKLLRMRHQADVVLGFYGRSVDRPMMRKVISRVFTHLMNLVAGTKLEYVTCAGIYKSCCLPELVSRGFAVIAELNLKVAMSGSSLMQTQITFDTRAKLGGEALSLRTLVDHAVLSLAIFRIRLKRRDETK